MVYKLVVAIVIIFLFIPFTFSVHANAKTYGAAISLKEAVSVKKAIEDFDTYKEKDILITGTVEKVCQKKGCWLTIKTASEDLRVTFKDYGFFVPLSSVGQHARIQGRLERHEISVKDQKHFLNDEGASSEVVKAVKEPKVDYSFVASSVEFKEKHSSL